MVRLGKFTFGIFAMALCAAGTVRASGSLSIESSPSGAEVWYSGADDSDKKYLGDTPMENRELPVGKYNIWLILSSHDTLAIPDVFIAEGQVTQMTREIPTHYGNLEVNTVPDSADIWLDGVRIGPSPYVNNLVLPGKYALKALPREAYLKTTTRSVIIGKGDSIALSLLAPYRDKSFMHENLSLVPWFFQFEAGAWFRSHTGFYSNSGKRESFSTDALDLPTQWDYPLTVRLGLPSDIELHLTIPFKASQGNRDTVVGGANFKSNMTFGAKYTYRPLNVGLDMTYGLGFKKSSPALDHDFLVLTAIAMAAKGKIYGEAQAGFEFHFSSKENNKFDPGDVGKVHVQAGYLLDPFTPYLGAAAIYHLEDKVGGKASPNTVRYLLIPEPGFTLDFGEDFSLQFGVPFTIVGKIAPSYWGLHLSLSTGLSLL